MLRATECAFSGVLTDEVTDERLIVGVEGLVLDIVAGLFGSGNELTTLVLRCSPSSEPAVLAVREAFELGTAIEDILRETPLSAGRLFSSPSADVTELATDPGLDNAALLVLDAVGRVGGFDIVLPARLFDVAVGVRAVEVVWDTAGDLVGPADRVASTLRAALPPSFECSDVRSAAGVDVRILSFLSIFAPRPPVEFRESMWLF